MQKIGKIIQVAFTYIGTVVGAGFASGQEILQFFTRYGWLATLTIGFSSILFVWLGVKVMLLSQETDSKSYEDLNRHVFGDRFGSAFSLFLLFVLLGTATVMMAGAGSLLLEQFHMNYQTGLLITLVLGFLVISRGMQGILAVNSVVVPVMIFFSITIFATSQSMPTSANWLDRTSDFSLFRIWMSPFLYSAYNLATAQAVLVPLGSSVQDRSVIRIGGIVGGIGIGLMLLAAHISLSAHMPGIMQFEIPTGFIIAGLGRFFQLLFILVIFGEIFTTFVGDVYGLTLQIKERTGIGEKTVIFGILAISYLLSQFGFRSLLSSLYPLFGLISLIWLVMLARYRKPPIY